MFWKGLGYAFGAFLTAFQIYEDRSVWDMRTFIVYHSEHHLNTEKVGKEIAQVLDADFVKAQSAASENISNYDLFGFGSGIYHGQFHRKLYDFVKKLHVPQGTKAFIFSTTGSKAYADRAHQSFQSVLVEKGFTVVGEYTCLGFDTALSSEGINRGRPNAEDLTEARSFAANLRS